MKEPITSLTAEDMRDLIQGAGFRAEMAIGSEGIPMIRSASNGVTFEIRLLHPQREKTTGFTGAMFMVGLQIHGIVAPDFLNRWNSTKRFGRLYVAKNYLVLVMDIFLDGGVTREHVRAQIDIWDRLLQDLLSYAREMPNTTTANIEAEAGSTTSDSPAGVNGDVRSGASEAGIGEPEAPEHQDASGKQQKMASLA